MTVFLFRLFTRFVFLASTCKWNHIVFVFVWIISLSKILSRSIPVVTNDKISFFFMANSPQYKHTHRFFFIHSLDQGHLDCSHILAIVNNAATNIEVHVSFQISLFVFFRYIPRSAIAGSYSSSIFNILRNLHSVFCSGCINLPPTPQQCTSISFHPYPCRHLLFVLFLTTAILTGLRWHVKLFHCLLLPSFCIPPFFFSLSTAEFPLKCFSLVYYYSILLFLFCNYVNTTTKFLTLVNIFFWL